MNFILQPFTHLLASDMDGTVIPLDKEPQRAAEINAFCRLIESHTDLALAYITGRHLELGLAGVKQHGLPLPHIFVCDVGTTIYLRNNEHWQKDMEYRQLLQHAWHNLTGSDIALLLEDIPDLQAQEEERQKEFKQSYYAPLGIEQQSLTTTIKERLYQHDITANVIYSVDPLKHVALIDILPEIAAKDYALDYLWKRLQLNKNNIAYAGDSGNDLLAFVSGFNAIVVNNTPEDVKESVRRAMSKKSIESHLFFASHDYVKGVIEGCYHYKIFSSQTPAKAPS